MIMFSYHVTHGVDKNIIQVETKDLTTITNAVKGSFSLAADFIIQLWDTDFEEWVNLRESSSLPDKGKLLIVDKREYLKHNKVLITIIFFERASKL